MRLLFVCVLSCSLFAAGAQSHHPELPFEHLNIPGTINSSQVYDMIQDHHGLIWVAGNGLYRYDGYKFTQYRNVNDSVSIIGQEVHTVFNDPIANRILIGTHSYGIVAYDYTSEQFSIIPTENGVPIISHIAQTNDGTVWGSSFTHGLFFTENDTLRKFTGNSYKFSSNSVIMAYNNTLLVGGGRSIYVIREKKVVDSVFLTFPDYTFPPSTRITALANDKTGKLYIGTEQAGVLVYDTLSKTFIKHFKPDADPFHIRINKIMADRNGRIWILTKSEGLVVYSPDTDNYIHVVKNPVSERSLSGNNCTSIIQDLNGIIWVGATGDLNKYDPSKIKFRHIYNNPFAYVSLSDNMVRGVFEAPDKKLWVGTEGGVIHIFDEKKMQVEKIEIKLGAKTRVSPMYFSALTKDVLLIGSSEGLLQINQKTKHIEYYRPLEKETKGRQVRMMLTYNKHLFIISYGRLLSQNLETKKIKVYNDHQGAQPFLQNTTMLYADSKNRLWVGARDGIFLYDSLTDSFRKYSFKKPSLRPQGSYFMILSIEEFQGKLWIGTFNDGLWTLDPTDLDNPVITQITRKNDISTATIYCTLPDEAGNLWMSTNMGITRYTPETDRYTDFTVSEGLQQDEFNRLSYAKLSTGEIVMGGINGLNIFNPQKIDIQEEDYSPHFLSISAFDENQNTTHPLAIGNDSTISLPHDQNDVDISFFVPNYRNPKRYEVYYSLTGYSTVWTKAETNTVHYSNLKPGTYIFQLKTVSSTGVEKTASLTFIILEPFWQTWWFIVLAAISTCLIVATIIQASLHNSRRDKERLEELLSERTREIEKSREALATLNQKKDLIFSILSHDLRSPLTTLKGFLSILIDDNKLTHEDIKKHALSIRNSVTSSLDLIDNTLFWSLSQTGNITYTPSSFSLNELLYKIRDLYQLMTDRKKISLTISVSNELKLYADENMIYVVLRNLVSNALKFTPQGKSVAITAMAINAHACIAVADEGIGMSSSYLEKLFTEEQLPLVKGTHDEKGTGIGLILCRNFIQLNHGKLFATSVEGEGSRFVVELPLAQD